MFVIVIVKWKEGIVIIVYEIFFRNGVLFVIIIFNILILFVIIKMIIIFKVFFFYN